MWWKAAAGSPDRDPASGSPSAAKPKADPRGAGPGAAVRWRVASGGLGGRNGELSRNPPSHGAASDRRRRIPGSASPRTANPNPGFSSGLSPLERARSPHGTQSVWDETLRPGVDG